MRMTISKEDISLKIISGGRGRFLFFFVHLPLRNKIKLI